MERKHDFCPVRRFFLYKNTGELQTLQTDNIGLNKSHATNTQEEHLYEKPSRSMKKIKELEMEI